MVDDSGRVRAPLPNSVIIDDRVPGLGQDTQSVLDSLS